MSAFQGRQVPGDQRAANPVARGACSACKGSGIKGLAQCSACEGTGDIRKAALARAYRTGVADGQASMRNAIPSELDLQRDVEGLIQELKWWTEEETT